MKVTWLGQAGLLFDNGSFKIMIDPYFSDSVGRIDGKKHRRIPVPTDALTIEPDVLIFTHDHSDHYDHETAELLLGIGRSTKTVLAPRSAWEKARMLGGDHNYVLLDRGCEWTERGFRFTSVGAVHSDPCAIGVVIHDLSDGRKFYVTGDTLYSHKILSELPEEIDAIFLPINGSGNNMNKSDAERFAASVGARVAIPYHVGMMDELCPEIFELKSRLILTPFFETEI